MCLGFLYIKKVQGKNKVTRNLSSSVIEKFNGYEIIRGQLSCQEKIEISPVVSLFTTKGFQGLVLSQTKFTLPIEVMLAVLKRE